MEAGAGGGAGCLRHGLQSSWQPRIGSSSTCRLGCAASCGGCAGTCGAASARPSRLGGTRRAAPRPAEGYPEGPVHCDVPGLARGREERPGPFAALHHRRAARRRACTWPRASWSASFAAGRPSCGPGGRRPRGACWRLQATSVPTRPGRAGVRLVPRERTGVARGRGCSGPMRKLAVRDGSLPAAPRSCSPKRWASTVSRLLSKLAACRSSPPILDDADQFAGLYRGH